MEGADEGMTPHAYGSTPDSDSDSEDELEEVQQYFAQIDGTDADGFLRILRDERVPVSMDGVPVFLSLPRRRPCQPREDAPRLGRHSPARAGVQ